MWLNVEALGLISHTEEKELTSATCVHTCTHVHTNKSTLWQLVLKLFVLF